MSEEKLDYFINSTDKRLERIEDKLEQLIGFRAWLLGICAAISAIIGIIMNMYFKP